VSLLNHSFTNFEIAEKGFEIFLQNRDWKKNIRAIGVRLTDPVTADSYIQFSLFDEDNKRFRREIIDKSIDNIRDRFGHYKIQRGLLLQDKRLNANPVEENVIHPISYFR
jgi:hypothetical protein